MPLRVAFDMDGVLADFESAFREVEVRLFGEDTSPAPEQPEARASEEEKSDTPKRRASDRTADPRGGGGASRQGSAQAAVQAAAAPQAQPNGESAQEPEEDERVAPTRRKLDRVWAAIEATPNFWTTLKPIDPDAVSRIQEMTLRHGWEVFFITQRPKTAGESVQRQTQRWLVQHGFDWPSVLVIPGSRGKAAAALHLDYLVDDSPKNCVDVIADSKARAVLIVRDSDERVQSSARRLGIGVVSSIGKCLDILDHATEVRSQPTLMGRLARMVGWRA